MLLSDVESAKLLVENISRHQFGMDWERVITKIDTSGLHADTHRTVVVWVSSYSWLEMLGESANDLGFTVDRKTINSSSLVLGQAGQDWRVTQTWWFTLTDADKNDPSNYPGATPKGVPIRFIHSETLEVPRPEG